MTVREIYEGSDGNATKALYARLDEFGPIGFIAKNLFRACKASERAKLYSRRYKGDAYQKKQWSLGLLCDALAVHGPAAGIRYGWKIDPQPPVGYPWILYVDLPTGQVSFHSPTRGVGPDYPGEWSGKHTSKENIILWTAHLMGEAVGGLIPNTAQAPPPLVIESCAVRKNDEDDYFAQLEAWKRKHGLRSK